MLDAIVQSLLYSLAPVIGMVLGGLAAVWKPPGERVQSYIQHFAAGLVFAAVGVEILPDVMERGDPLAASLGFIVGVAAMLAIRTLSRRAESQSEDATDTTPWALVVAIGIDVFVDGMLIGVGFAAGETQGVLLAISMTGCTISLGLATAAALMRSGSPRRRAAMLTSLVGLLPAIGAVVGAAQAAQLSGAWMEGVISFTCAALLYLITEELLVEAHEAQERPETTVTTAVFFVGFLALLVTEMLMRP